MLFYFSFSRLWEALGQMVSAPRTLAREVWVRGLWVNKKKKTSLSQCLSPAESMSRYQWIVREAWWNAGRGGWPCDGMASHPGGSSNTRSRFMLWKLGQTPAGWADRLECRLNLILPRVWATNFTSPKITCWVLGYTSPLK